MKEAEKTLRAMGFQKKRTGGGDLYENERTGVRICVRETGMTIRGGRNGVPNEVIAAAEELMDDQEGQR